MDKWTDEEGSAILEIISSAKSEPFHSLLNQESYFYPSPPSFLSPFALGAYGVLSLRITPPIRTCLDGLSTALRIAALRLLLELILKADQVWRSTDLLSSCQAEGARRICERSCASVDELVARAHARSSALTRVRTVGLKRWWVVFVGSLRPGWDQNHLKLVRMRSPRSVMEWKGQLWWFAVDARVKRSSQQTDAWICLFNSYIAVDPQCPINIKILSGPHICSLLATCVSVL